ncbi:MAG: hypothetical protein DRI26_03095 [Chloroflexi bacterium]|nr:MAG: hypothetical protein DRI26_03095 [Chloroflexota bacterium]
MLSPSLALLLSLAGMLVLLRLKVPAGVAVFVGSLILTVLARPLSIVPGLLAQAVWNLETLRLLVIVVTALTLSYLMEARGLLSGLAATMECLSPRLAMYIVPAMVGLVPMPAGALVSATAVRGLAERMGLSPERATFINYWFRHVWEFSLPMYPAIIIASVVLSLRLSTVIVALLPLTGLALIFGIIFSHRMLRVRPASSEKGSGNLILELARNSWPVLLLVMLILLGLDAGWAFPLVLLAFILQQRVRWSDLAQGLKYGLSPLILLLLYAIMLYKGAIEDAEAAASLFLSMQSLGLPAAFSLMFLPFLIGLAAGASFGFAGITFPLLAPLISATGSGGFALLLAYASGMTGLLLSPAHLCLTLSAEYFEARLSVVYRYLLPPLILIETAALLLYFLAG